LGNAVPVVGILWKPGAEENRRSLYYATEYGEDLSQQDLTQVVPLNGFYPAEGYHQDYLKHHTDNPYIVINDLPKIQNLKKQFPEL